MDRAAKSRHRYQENLQRGSDELEDANIDRIEGRETASGERPISISAPLSKPEVGTRKFALSHSDGRAVQERRVASSAIPNAGREIGTGCRTTISGIVAPSSTPVQKWRVNYRDAPAPPVRRLEHEGPRHPRNAGTRPRKRKARPPRQPPLEIVALLRRKPRISCQFISHSSRPRRSVRRLASELNRAVTRMVTLLRTDPYGAYCG